MSEAKHTPGPWHTHAGHSGITIEYARLPGREPNNPPSMTYIAVVNFGRSGARRGMAVRWHKNAADEANARLIAAAPDLLSIARRWAALDGGVWHQQRYAAEKAELLSDTLAAIAKATNGGANG